MSTARRLRVATIITRLEGGAGVLAFRAATALGQEGRGTDNSDRQRERAAERGR